MKGYKQILDNKIGRNSVYFRSQLEYKINWITLANINAMIRDRIWRKLWLQLRSKLFEQCLYDFSPTEAQRNKAWELLSEKI
jgi:hypothetical protein